MTDEREREKDALLVTIDFKFKLSFIAIVLFPILFHIFRV